MGKHIQETPLTQEEQKFAEENIELIKLYLNIRKLPVDEWYDVVVFWYLLSVKRWFCTPELHQYKFKTIAFTAMQSAVWNEMQKMNRRIKTISLDEEIPGTDGITYLEGITYKNLNYIGYMGLEREEMNIKYNVQLPERKSNYVGRKSDETIAIEGFLLGKMKNMCFEYDTDEEAKKKLSVVQANRRKNKHQKVYDVYRVKNCIYVVRLADAKKK